MSQNILLIARFALTLVMAQTLGCGTERHSNGALPPSDGGEAGESDDFRSFKAYEALGDSLAFSPPEKRGLLGDQSPRECAPGGIPSYYHRDLYLYFRSHRNHAMTSGALPIDAILNAIDEANKTLAARKARWRFRVDNDFFGFAAPNVPPEKYKTRLEFDPTKFLDLLYLGAHGYVRKLPSGESAWVVEGEVPGPAGDIVGDGFIQVQPRPEVYSDTFASFAKSCQSGASKLFVGRSVDANGCSQMFEYKDGVPSKSGSVWFDNFINFFMNIDCAKWVDVPVTKKDIALGLALNGGPKDPDGKYNNQYAQDLDFAITNVCSLACTYPDGDDDPN